VLRLEDLDTPRNSPGSAAHILNALQAMGFEWDGPVLFQSKRLEAYRSAFEKLRARGVLYTSRTSRTGLEYEEGQTAAWKMRTTEFTVRFPDRRLGEREIPAENFVVLRTDGIFSYQFAVVVDDAAQGVTDVVRGADLLDSTPRQIALIRALGLAQPEYLHLPIVTNPDGEKLSKQNGAKPIDLEDGAGELRRALLFLGQEPPAELKRDGLRAVWKWAIANWNPEKIAKSDAVANASYSLASKGLRKATHV
jgi:glutamyl-Q tRNA(Asp) synthetase